MATVMNQNRTQHITIPRSMTQKICIGMGIFFILIGLGGILIPGMFGMHLSIIHNLIHLMSGGIALWSGYADVPRRAYHLCIGFGVVYRILGVSGFVFGEPGYPGVGHMEADENLLRIIPNALEFGSADHSLHAIISAVFLITAYAWKKHDDVQSKIVVTQVERNSITKNVK